jgi:leucyl aminopeptidase
MRLLPEHKNQISWDCSDFQVEFIIQKKSTHLDPKSICWVALEKSFIKKYAAEPVCKEFSERIIKDSEKFIAENSGDTIGKEPYSNWAYSYTEGGSLNILGIENSLTPFMWHEAIRKSLAGLLGKAESTKSNIVLDLSRITLEAQQLVVEAVGALVEINSWNSPSYKKAKKDPQDSKKSSKEKEKIKVYVTTKMSPSALKTLSHRGQVWGRSLNLVRTLAERAGNDLHPKTYVEEIKKLCGAEKISFEYWDEKTLTKKNAGAFLAVSQANTGQTYSGIVVLKTRSRNAKNKTLKHLSLVGKGLCYDTGGYNIKTGSYMYGMHADMTGSAVALATLLFMREVGENLNISCWLAISENLISPTGFRPNDVVQTAKGLSVEVIDTDAEGRMVLADTLYFASSEKPDLLVDYATLTGAATRAIGIDHCAVFSNQPSWLDLATEAGVLSGERVWGFPLGGTFERSLKSDIADIKQCSKTVYCDHIYAATFLSRFVDSEVPWVHVDLSAHEFSGGLGLVPSDTTGFGVLFTQRLASFI